MVNNTDMTFYWKMINGRLSTMISTTTQAGYGRFNITTVWLDAAEPERPTMDTVGQFLFSKGDQWWRKDQYANQMISLLSSSDYHEQGTDAEIGSAWVQQHTRTFAEGFARQVVIFIFMRFILAAVGNVTCLRGSRIVYCNFSEGFRPDEFFTLPRPAWTGSWRLVFETE